MPRRLRNASGGVVYHVFNRAVGRRQIFHDDDDYLAFERVMERTVERIPMRIVSYCLMPNHWHLVLWPAKDGQMSDFMRLLTVTHTQRWHAHHHSAGTGPVYQGRFKSFPVQADEHVLWVCRYVERNAVRANLVKSAREWLWGSPAKRRESDPPAWLMKGSDWPVEMPRGWEKLLDRAQTDAEIEAVQRSIKRGRPLGDERWTQRIAKLQGLESTLREQGRPRVRGMGEQKGT